MVASMLTGRQCKAVALWRLPALWEALDRGGSPLLVSLKNLSRDNGLQKMTCHFSRRLSAVFLAATLLLGISACAGIPAQEMSNARQAIRAAQEAGAATAAPGEIEKAQEYLGRAEASMQQRQFRQARDEASEARRIATAALEAAQAAKKTSP